MSTQCMVELVKHSSASGAVQSSMSTQCMVELVKLHEKTAMHARRVFSNSQIVNGSHSNINIDFNDNTNNNSSSDKK